MKSIFCAKNEAQISSAYLCRYDLQNGVRKFFLNKWVSRYLNFGDFKIPKNGSLQ